MKSWGKRLLIAFVVAWLLPFPGVHIDTYLPLIWVAAKGIGDAEAAFYMLLVCLLAVYTALVFTVLYVPAWLHALRGK